MNAIKQKIIDQEEAAWSQCCFISKARAKNGYRIAWQPPQFKGDTMPNYIAKNLFGFAAAADFVSFLRSPSDYDEADRLTDVVEAMTGVKLGPTESCFLRGISAYIIRGRIDVTAHFDLVPCDEPAPLEGGTA